MVVAKGTISSRTTIKNGRLTKTELGLPEDFKSLEAYLRPMINDFVNRRVLPTIPGEGMFVSVTHVKIRETKRGQTVEIEAVGVEQDGI